MDQFDRKWGWIIGLILFIPLYLMPALAIDMSTKLILGGFIVFFIVNFVIHYFLCRKSKDT